MCNNILLSICIPIYNRGNLFRYSLMAAAEALSGYEEMTEIVISDNASAENIFEVVEKVKQIFPNFRIKYSRNNYNIGLAANFLKVVELAEGKFCWIIGSDDFILPNGVESLLSVISKNPDINFISVRYYHLNLLNILDKTVDDHYHRVPQALKDQSMLKPNKAPNWCGRVNSWDKLVDPLYNNVMLGAVMACVFRKELWDSVDKNGMNLDNFESVESIYPHCFIFAQCMPGKVSYYYGNPVIVVGDGAREWAGITTNDFWINSLPVITLKVLWEIIDKYQDGGLDCYQVKKCRIEISKEVGKMYVPFLIRRYILHKPIKSQEQIKPKKILFSMGRYYTFYYGVIVSIVKGILRPFKRMLLNSFSK